MSDRELMEFAAKAMGYVPAKIYSDKTKSLIWASESGFPTAWKPLVDNSDAFELMVRLNLFVFHGWTSAMGVPVANVVVDNAEQTTPSGEIKGDDPYAATRRAIVRAAAEIGKKMEKANV